MKFSPCASALGGAAAEPRRRRTWTRSACPRALRGQKMGFASDPGLACGPQRVQRASPHRPRRPADGSGGAVRRAPRAGRATRSGKGRVASPAESRDRGSGLPRASLVAEVAMAATSPPTDRGASRPADLLPPPARIEAADVLAALRAGWGDFRRVPAFGPAFSASYVAAGLRLVAPGVGDAGADADPVAGLSAGRPLRRRGALRGRPAPGGRSASAWGEVLAVVAAERGRRIPWIGGVILAAFPSRTVLAHLLLAPVLGPAAILASTPRSRYSFPFPARCWSRSSSRSAGRWPTCSSRSSRSACRCCSTGRWTLSPPCWRTFPSPRRAGDR